MKSQVLFILLFLLMSNISYGQVSSGSGIDPAGNPANLPATDSRSANYNPNMPGAPLGSTGQQQEAWAERWGAIATDVGAGITGAVADMQSKNEAQAGAIESCEQRGGHACLIDVAYRNQCAVIVSAEDWSTVVNAETKEFATKIGMERCQHKNKNCWVYYSACSLPERIQ